MSKMHGGKGDRPRPLGVPIEQFDSNFEAIFGKKEKRTEPVPFAGHIELEEENHDEQT
jgi:hypothetical protein